MEHQKPGFAPKDITNHDINLFGLSPELWIPVLQHGCTFSPSIFSEVMLNLIKNPNINSTHLVRADILCDSSGIFGLSKNITIDDKTHEIPIPRQINIPGFELRRIIIRRLIPRNPQLDKSLVQSCHILHASPCRDVEKNLIIYTPHVDSPSAIPWYHPRVRSLAFLYTSSLNFSTISLHYCPFSSQTTLDSRLLRTAHQLLSTVYKHGMGCAAGYTKRVHHDVVIPQERFQDTYARLKAKHAKRLIDGWVEVTDPAKHVFEDLGIASFLIELWADMYLVDDDDDDDGQRGQGTGHGDDGKVIKKQNFPGFVDIGCGNGVLVDILTREGYEGWGFDARRRKTWDIFDADVQARLQERVLVPFCLSASNEQAPSPANTYKERGGVVWHDGLFPPDTFIISNHADELTPWTPLLASLSNCAFIIIPCCSHNLAGARFRASASTVADATRGYNGSTRAQGKQASAYASLVAWVERLARDCGYTVEKEMLRIPSTRNTALIGRKRETEGVDVREILRQEGGGDGWVERAVTLTASKARGH